MMTKFRYSTDGGSTWTVKDETLPYNIPTTPSQSVIVEPIGAAVTNAGAATPVSISGTPPTTGTVGQPYSFTPTTANGAGTKTFTLTSGTLLGGLSFSTTTGVISGSPTVAGTMSGLVVRVADNTGTASTTATNVTIADAVASGIPQQARLLHRWMADSITPQTNDTAVATWTDSVGGLTATALTNLNGGPRYLVNKFNGKPALGHFRMGMTVNGFAGTAFETATKAAKGTILFVMGARFNGNAPATSFQGGFGDFYPIAGTVAGMGMSGGGRSVPHQDGFATMAIGLEAGSFIRINSGSVWQHYDAYPFGGNFTLGGFANGFTDGMFNGELIEVLYWDVELTQAEHIQFEKYIRDKYAQPYPWAANSRYHLFDGDSITRGQSNPEKPEFSYPYKVAASLGLKYGAWSNVGKGGWTWDQLEARAVSDLDKVPAQIGKPVYLYTFEWYNQSQISSAADTISKARTYLTNRVAANFVTVFGTSTDFSSPNDANRRAARKTYNDYWDVASNRTGLVNTYVRIHTDTSIGVEGSAATDGNTTYFADGIHLKDGGYTKLANVYIAAGTVA